MIDGRSIVLRLVKMPTRTAPRSSPSPRAASRIRSTASTAPRASRSTASPAAVNRTPCGSRSKSGAPSSRSSARMPADTVDWAANRRSAARVKFSSSATATRYSSWRVSIQQSYPSMIRIDDIRWTRSRNESILRA
ncbi:hypothetical protein FHX33_001579 [Leifsonia aquatica]|uniref:Uncharacterized protein n=1 Tax=Leifsonia aquatica TaxID=144185 RepID=A0A7W4YIW3_LEIAQ|nr:hypothetical protein [Leifsonia aquatica]